MSAQQVANRSTRGYIHPMKYGFSALSDYSENCELIPDKDEVSSSILDSPTRG